MAPPPDPAPETPPPTTTPTTEKKRNRERRSKPDATTTTTTTAPQNQKTTQKADTRTIASKGGTVAVRYEGGSVRLLWARPNHDYDVSVVEDGPKYVAVRFSNDRYQSHVIAYYKDGQPSQYVDERRNRGGDDDDRIEPRNVSWDEQDWKRWAEERGWDTRDWGDWRD